MRIRKRRILPATWPRTTWSLSSFTRNMALGRASMTSPSNSTFSSLAIPAGTVPVTGRPGEPFASGPARAAEGPGSGPRAAPAGGEAAGERSQSGAGAGRHRVRSARWRRGPAVLTGSARLGRLVGPRLPGGGRLLRRRLVGVRVGAARPAIAAVLALAIV